LNYRLSFALLFQAGLTKIFEMVCGMRFCLLTVIKIGFVVIISCFEGKVDGKEGTAEEFFH